MNHEIVVEIAFALPGVQALTSVALKPGSTVADALEQSGIYDREGGRGLRSLPAGIWGRRVDRHQIVSNGDRIELYRSLQIDPKEARRRLAAAGRTMGQSGSG